MIRHFFALGVLGLLFTFAAQPVLAARWSDGYLSVELPKGWKASEEVNALSFASPAPDYAYVITTVVQDYEEGYLPTLVRSDVKDGMIQWFGDSSCIYTDKWDGRYWKGMASDGTVFSITVKEPSEPKVVADFLNDMQPGKNADENFSLLLKDLKKEEVIAWLSFAAPNLPADPALAEKNKKREKSPGEYTVKPFSGNGFTAQVPQEWHIELVGGDTVIFTSEQGRDDGFVMAAMFPLPDNTQKAFETFCTAFVKDMGGKNISTEEGVISFTGDEDATGYFEQYERAAFLKMFLENDALSKEVEESIQLEGY